MHNLYAQCSRVDDIRLDFRSCGEKLWSKASCLRWISSSAIETHKQQGIDLALAKMSTCASPNLSQVRLLMTHLWANVADELLSMSSVVDESTLGDCIEDREMFNLVPPWWFNLLLQCWLTGPAFGIVTKPVRFWLISLNSFNSELTSGDHMFQNYLVPHGSTDWPQYAKQTLQGCFASICTIQLFLEW